LFGTQLVSTVLKVYNIEPCILKCPTYAAPTLHLKQQGVVANAFMAFVWNIGLFETPEELLALTFQRLTDVEMHVSSQITT